MTAVGACCIKALHYNVTQNHLHVKNGNESYEQQCIPFLQGAFLK
jgi:hypothetical protein